MSSGTIAAMVERFRNSAPTHRSERSTQRDKGELPEFWWKKEGTESSSMPLRNSKGSGRLRMSSSRRRRKEKENTFSRGNDKFFEKYDVDLNASSSRYDDDDVLKGSSRAKSKSRPSYRWRDDDPVSKLDRGRYCIVRHES